MKTYRNMFIKGMIGILILFLGCNVLLYIHYYNEYKNKVSIVYTMMLDDKSERLDAACNILKEGKFKENEGKEKLGKYGYFRRNGIVFYKQFKRNCVITTSISVFIYIVIGYFLLRLERKRKQIEDDGIQELEAVLLHFREESKQLERLDWEGFDVAPINDQLEALKVHLMSIKEQAYKEKEETKRLVTDISHQLKTPVAALETCFTILVEGKLNDEEKEEFEGRCRDVMDGLKVLLEALLQISRMEAGLIELRLERNEIIPTVVSAMNRVYSQALQKNIEILFDAQEQIEHLEILHDTKWFCEVLIIVLDNAIKYSDNNSKIKIKLSQRISFFKIEIEDQGIGIPKEEYHNIFKRFYRGRSKIVHEKSGSGIGLYLAREIMDLHNGTITVESGKMEGTEEYFGSKFVLLLPLVE